MDTKQREKIRVRLCDDYHYVKTLGYKVLGVFLQGSQNYQLDYEGSDVDTKVILIPSFNDFALNKKPVSTTLVRKDNTHIDIKDIRLMHQCFRKQNINFLEILFTQYMVVNPAYKDIYEPMFENRDRIAHYNNYAAVNCIAGMVFEKRHALCHPYPAVAEEIEKRGFDPKQLHHILRCEEFLKRYVHGIPYAECLIPTKPEDLIKIKANCPYDLEQAIEIADNCVEIVKDVKQRYMEEYPVVVDKDVDKIMDDVLINVLKCSFKEEIGE